MTEWVALEVGSGILRSKDLIGNKLFDITHVASD